MVDPASAGLASRESLYSGALAGLETSVERGISRPSSLAAARMTSAQRVMFSVSPGMVAVGWVRGEVLARYLGMSGKSSPYGWLPLGEGKR